MNNSKTTYVGKAWSAGTSLDNSIAARIWYIGEEDSGTVTIASSVMTLQHGDLASEAVDTTVGSSGVLTMTGATLDTFLEVMNEVNSSPNWYMELECALSDDSTNTYLLDRAETQAKVKAGIPLFFDGSNSDLTGCSIGGSIFRSCTPTGRIGEEAIKGLLAYVHYSGTFTGAAYLKIYSANQTDTNATATLLFQSVALTDSTAETVGDASTPIGQGVYESDIGERLVVRVDAATTQATMEYFNVLGTLKDYSGIRV